MTDCASGRQWIYNHPQLPDTTVVNITRWDTIPERARHCVMALTHLLHRLNTFSTRGIWSEVYRYGQYYSRVHRQHQLLPERYNSTSTCSTSTCSTSTWAVPAAPDTAVYPCCSTPITLSFTTCQHNTDTTMGITITDNLVDTTLYRDHYQLVPQPTRYNYHIYPDP